MRRAIRSRYSLGAVLLAVLAYTPDVAQAISGRLIVRLEGTVVGAVPPSLILQGSDRQESVLLSLLEVSSGEVRFTDVPPGTYLIMLEGGGSADQDLPRAMEVAIIEGRTSVVRLDLDEARFRGDPARPDPFGVDETWDGGWLEMLPGAGEETALAALTTAATPRRVMIEGLDVLGTGFRNRTDLGGASIARNAVIPIGPTSAAHEGATRQIVARTQDAYVDVEAATGSAGQTSWEGTATRNFPGTVGKPRLFVSLRGLQYLDAAPSVFEEGRLPHSGLEGLELLTRVGASLSEQTQLTGLLYGEGTIQKYFLEAFRRDPRHGPREERANLHAALRATHDARPDLRFLGEFSTQRTFVESGDGKYFDDLLGYGRELGPGVDDSGLYWEPGHAYDYFHRKVHIDRTGRLETWHNPGTERSTGAGILIRQGTYRSYEHLQPSDVYVNVAGGIGGYNQAQSIGYDLTGAKHADQEGMEPGKPTTLSAFLTARRPVAGGDAEVGLRGTHYRSGQRPLRSLADPLGDDENFQMEDLGDERSTTTIDPRVGFTRALSDRTRLWLAGGAETWLPPAEAVYFSTKFLETAAYLAPSGNEYPPPPIFGNPNLEPERAWTGLAAIGAEVSPTLWVRIGLEGRQVRNAITPREFLIGEGSLAYYVNDGTRDLIDLSLRADWEPVRRLRMRASYDLSRARTETIEPSLLDAAWLAADLPIRTVDLREGLLPVLPPYDDGIDRGFYPSLYDRRHRLSLAATAHTPSGLIGEAGRVIFTNLDVGLLFHLASGQPFSQTVIYPAGSLNSKLLLPEEVDPNKRNGVRTPWSGQLDLRLARGLQLFGIDGQLWVEITNLTDQRNEIRVYQATGEGDDDGWLDNNNASEEPEYAETYAKRIRDHHNYGDPFLMHAGLRFHLP